MIHPLLVLLANNKSVVQPFGLGKFFCEFLSFFNIICLAGKNIDLGGA